MYEALKRKPEESYLLGNCQKVRKFKLSALACETFSDFTSVSSWSSSGTLYSRKCWHLWVLPIVNASLSCVWCRLSWFKCTYSLSKKCLFICQNLTHCSPYPRIFPLHCWSYPDVTPLLKPSNLRSWKLFFWMHSPLFSVWSCIFVHVFSLLSFFLHWKWSRNEYMFIGIIPTLNPIFAKQYT